MLAALASVCLGVALSSSCGQLALSCADADDCPAGFSCDIDFCVPVGVSVVDAGAPLEDGGAPLADGGALADAGLREDGGALEDAGVALEDAGAPLEDGGAPLDDAGVQGPWWDTSFLARHRVALVNTGAAVSDVPVALVFATADFDATTLGDTSCVIDGDHATSIPFELERAEIDGRTTVWLRVPDVSAVDELFIYTQGPAGSCPNAPAAVWSGLYRGVWHLDGLGDSLAQNDLVNNGTTSAPGAVGRGRRTSDTAFLDVDAPVGLVLRSALTVEAFFAADQLGADAFDNTLVRFGGDSKLSGDNILYSLSVEAGPNHAIAWESGTGVNHVGRSGGYAFALEVPHHVAWTRDAEGANLFFLDGTIVGTATLAPLPDGGGNGILRIGGNPGVFGLGAAGVIDEVRISADVKPPAWIDFQVRTMRGQVATLGTEEPL